MSFGAGFGSGMGAGMGSGIAVGILTGKKQARDAIRARLRRFAETHTIEIRDERGREVPLDEFADEVLGPEPEAAAGSRGRMLVAVALGVAAFVGAVLLVFILAM